MTDTPDRMFQRRPSSGPAVQWIMIGGLAIAAALVAVMIQQRGYFSADRREADPSVAEFVNPDACYTCHPIQTALWRGSHHDLAMQVATEATVLGDFDDARFVHGEEETHFFRRGGGYYIHAPGPDGTPAEFPVLYTFGVDPLQQYLVDIGHGKLQSLTVAWDVDKGRWFHLQPDEFLPTSDPLHWTQPAYNWNARCAECHSTNLRKNYDLTTDSYKTTWSEVNVGCQGCHGPGSRHVVLSRAAAVGGAWGESRARGFALDLGGGSRAQVEACARCHSRRLEISDSYVYGEPLLAHYRPQALIDPLYYADGQIRDEVYVYGSFVQSKMYHAGVRCTDCHDPHTARLKLEGNALCARCHQMKPPEQFATLRPGDYDSPAHHFHPVGSRGAACVGCHMPETTYMVVDPRRDHSLGIPRPDLSVSLGAPNACGSCHVEGPQWAADHVVAWYGNRSKDNDTGPVFSGARVGDQRVSEALLSIAATDSLAEIVRVTALWELGGFPSQQTVQVAVEQLRDPSAWVRLAAVELLGGLYPAIGADEAARQKAAWLAPSLSDPLRAVRLVAARALVGISATLLTNEDQVAFEAALAEYRAAQDARADWAGSHLNLGAMHAAAGNVALAEAEYKTALRLDADFVEVRFNLANLYNSLGRNDEALSELRRVIALDPANGEGYYSLGLLQAETGDLASAAENLGTAASHLSNRPRVFYNWAVALDQVGRPDDALIALGRAQRLAPDDMDILNALVVFNAKEGRYEDALKYARRILVLDPQSDHAQKMVQDLERRAAQK